MPILTGPFKDLEGGTTKPGPRRKGNRSRPPKPFRRRLPRRGGGISRPLKRRRKK